MDVEIAPPHLFQLGAFTVTSAHLAAFFCTAFLIVVFLLAGRKVKMVPGKFQVAVEILFQWIYDMIAAQAPAKYVRLIFTIVMTSFLLILTSNFFIFFPILGSIMLGKHHMFTTPTAHLSMTIAMASVAIILGHIIMLTKSPLRHIGAFIRVKGFLKVRSGMDFMMAFIDLFIGVIEMVGELSKLISLSARLFGNILAGDIMLVVILGISTATNFIAPIPFLGLAVLAGVIQSVVYTLLAIQFLSATVSHVEHAQHAEHAAH